MGDEDLVKLFRLKQDTNCIGELYVRYGHLVMGTCMKYLKNVADSEDVTMQLFESLHNKLLKHEVSFFKSWLYMVAKNECFMALRKRGIAYSSGLFNDELTAAPLNEGSDSELNELADLRLERLEEVLPLLKDEQRMCVELFYLKEFSYQQISDELGIPLPQVKSAIQNGKRNLRIRLEEYAEFKTNELG